MTHYVMNEELKLLWKIFNKLRKKLYHDLNITRFDVLPLDPVDNLVDQKMVEFSRLFIKNLYYENKPLFTRVGEYVVKNHRFEILKKRDIPARYDEIYQPTSLLSILCILNTIQQLGKNQVFDIGFGDGRALFLGECMGLEAKGLEKDEDFVNMVNKLKQITNSNFEIHCDDAKTFDYSRFSPTNPAFIFCALGERFVQKVIKRIEETIPDVFYKSLFVMPGYGLIHVSSYKHYVLCKANLPVYWDSSGSVFKFIQFYK